MPQHSRAQLSIDSNNFGEDCVDPVSRSSRHQPNCQFRTGFASFERHQRRLDKPLLGDKIALSAKHWFAFKPNLCCIMAQIAGGQCPGPRRKLYIMQTLTEETPVLQKTKELCQAILDQPTMQSIRQRIDAFMGDEKSRAQYENLVNKGQALQEKEQMSVPLSREEINDFEKQREAVFNNPVARNFLDAQEELHTVQATIQQYVNKTLELGRMPTEEDLSGGGCGHGCGCHH